MSKLTFLAPEMLYLLIPLGLVIAAGFAVHFLLRKRFDLFISRYRAEAFSRLRPTWRWLVQLTLLGLTIVGALLMLAKPVLIQPAKHANFMVLLDFSKSTSVEDYNYNLKACDRMQMAQMALLALLEELPPESQLGVATFVGSSYSPDQILLVRTAPQNVGLSRNDLAMIINYVHWSQAWDGGSPIQFAVIEIVRRMRDNPGLYGENPTIILMTDGEEETITYGPYYEAGQKPPITDQPSKIYLSKEYFKDLGLKFKIVVIGLGTPSGGRIPEYDQDWRLKGYQKDYTTGEERVSKRNEAYLKELAGKMGADYLPLNGPEDLKILAGDTRYQNSTNQSQKDLSHYLALAALMFFLAAMIL